MRLTFALCLVSIVRSTDASQPAGQLTAEQLRAIMRALSKERAALFLEPLNKAMKEFEVNNPKRRAAFLAQVAHESGQLKYMEEIASGAAYEGRKDLGNTNQGTASATRGAGRFSSRDGPIIKKPARRRGSISKRSRRWSPPPESAAAWPAGSGRRAA